MSRARITTVPVMALMLAAFTNARGEMPPQPNERATLIVEGVVRESFTSVRPTVIDFLFEIEVRSARAGSSPERPFEGSLPGTGQVLYVHAFQRRPDAPQVPGPVGYRALPAEQETIRAYLYPRGQGGWQFAYPLGFERAGGGDSRPGSEPASPGVPRRIGVMVIPVALGNRTGLRVTEVTPGSPAGPLPGSSRAT